MIALIFFVLSVFFNSIMDACENEPNFNESIFKKLPKQFWLKEQSWKYAAKVFGYKIDAWHLSKSAMVICIVLAIIFFDLPVKKWQDVAVYLIIGGMAWNFFFWLFYHVCFKVK